MRTVILSGGNFGGESIEIDDDQTEITMTDEAGNKWIYDTTLSTTTNDATYKEFVPTEVS